MTRTAAALAARRRNTQAALDRVHQAITRLRRDKTPVTVAAVSRRADVSRTFLYTNPDAKTAVGEAIRESAAQRDRLQDEQDDAGAASWRERALNAEHALKTANHEIMTQRTRIAELLAAFVTWKPNGPRTRSTASPPRTPHSSSASANSPPTTAPSTNASRPHVPTCASKTGVSLTSKPGLSTPAPPADQREDALLDPRHHGVS